MFLLVTLRLASEASAGSAPTSRPTRAPSRLYPVELWIQPVGSTIYAVAGQAHLSIGANITLSENWMLVVGTAATLGRVSTADSSGAAFQLWLSVAPVRLFHAPGSASGFFLGPKVTFSTITNTEPVGYETCDERCQHETWHVIPPQTQLNTSFTLELGYRMQRDHFVFSFMFPTIGVGVAFNSQGGIFSTVLFGSPSAGSVAVSYDLNLELFRFGAAF